MASNLQQELITVLRGKGVDPATIDTAVAYTTKDKTPLTDSLLKMGVAAHVISAALSQVTGARFTTDPGAPTPDALELFKPKTAFKLQAMPLSHDAITNTTNVITTQALDPEHEALLASKTRSRVQILQVPTPLLKKLLQQHYTGNHGEDKNDLGMPVDLVPEAVARHYRAVPIRVEDGSLVVAIPANAGPTVGDDLRIKLGRPVRTQRKPAHEIVDLLQRAYGEEEAKAPQDGEDSPAEEMDAEQAALKDNATIKVVNDVIRHAISVGASDIHIDPNAENVVIRIRKDGVLSDYMTLPKTREKPIIARVKVLSRLNIADSLKAQDGRIRLRELDIEADMRVATQPTVHGEKVTMRLLQQAANIPELEDLGMAEDTFKEFKNLLNLPQGMILLTGPTGSGKSSTLFSYLKRAHTPEVNTMTIEDPVEYELEGINQSQINVKAGVTFPRALRAFVRHDPDIILVGEIRDEETALLATEAAITGHLVLSTVHTNDAPGTVTRLVEMGVEPYLLADALTAVLAQRLLRRVCQHCAVEDTPDPAVLEALGVTDEDLESASLRRGEGCDECFHSGYDGRLAVHELMIMNDQIEELVHTRASRGQVAAVAREAGMRTLREDGIEKAKRGLTTLEEVLKRTAV